MANDVVMGMPTTISDALDVLNDDSTPSKGTERVKSDKDDKVEPEKLDLESVDEELEPEIESEPDDEPETEKEDNDEDEKPDDLKIKDDEDEELELTQIPKRQEIKKKYPDFFKDFPQVERVMYREQQYAELFPSIASAKEAASRLEDFKVVENDLMSGNLTDVLRLIHKNNPDSFRKISDNIYETLVKVDKDSGNTTANKILKGTLKYLHDFSSASLKRNPNDDYADQLRIATQIVHRAMYNDPEVTGPEVLQNQQQNQEREDPEKKKFEAERQEFEQNRFKAAFEDVSSRIDNVLSRSISDNIDKNGVMTPYVKQNLVKDCMEELNKQLQSDKRFKDHIDRLWISARSDGYNQEAKSRLRKALLSKAQTVLPGIMRAKKAAALKGLGSSSSRVSNDNNEERNSPRNTGSREAPKERLTRTNRESGGRSRPEMKQGESAIDFLLRD